MREVASLCSPRPSPRRACAPYARRGTRADRAAGGCAGQGTKDDALIAKADDMLAKHHGDVSATSRAKYYQMAKEGETAAEVICFPAPAFVGTTKCTTLSLMVTRRVRLVRDEGRGVSD